MGRTDPAISRRTRPRTAEERAGSVRAARDLLATRPDLRGELRPAYDTYTRALRRYTAARARLDRVRPRAHAAAAAFEIALRGWAGTVIDEKKRRTPGRVAALLGGVLPGSL